MALREGGDEVEPIGTENPSRRLATCEVVDPAQDLLKLPTLFAVEVIGALLLEQRKPRCNTRRAGRLSEVQGAGQAQFLDDGTLRVTHAHAAGAINGDEHAAGQ